MKIIKYISAIAAAVAMTAFQTGCSEDLSEITKIDYDRAFSPTNLTATVINRTNVRLRWNANTSAASYTIELFAGDSLAFAGVPAVTISEVTASEIPYVVENLDGETRYSARIKAVSGAAEDSKWTGVTFKTDTEYLLLPFEDGDVTATSITFRWPAAQQVTQIVLNPGNIVHNVTSDEVAAGTATVEGLTGETAYTVRLLNGDKVRATETVTTLVDIGNAIAVHPEDDLTALLAAANDGDAFALFPGTYGDKSTFAINKKVEIKAVYPYDKPVLSGCITLSDNAGLLMQNIVMDGTGAPNDNQMIVFSTAGATYGDIRLENCEIRNYVKGVYYLNVASLVQSIVVDNCLIYNIECSGGDMFDSRTGAIKTLIISNNTIYDSAPSRDMIRYDNASANFPGISPQISVTHNTLYNVCNGTSRRLLYIRFSGHSIRFANNIVAQTQGQFSNQASTAIPTFENNDYFNAPGFHSGGVDGSGARFFDDAGLKENPLFANPGAGDFTVGNDLIIERAIGAPRWR